MTDRVEILLVEDTPSDIRLTQEALKDSKLEHTLTVKHDGEEGLEYLRKVAGTPAQPDIVLLDLNMPKKTGHEVLEEMHKISELDSTAVVLLTVSRDEDDILRALQVKMNYYLGKPVTSEQLNSLIEAIYDLSHNKPMKQKLAGRDEHIRYVLAGNPHTSPAVLEKLAAEGNAHIRRQVGENPKTPVSLLRVLANDQDADVRLAVADNPSAPVDLIEKLAHDLDPDVRIGIASNPRVPRSILKELSSDEQPHVVACATQTLNKLAS